MMLRILKPLATGHVPGGPPVPAGDLSGCDLDWLTRQGAVEVIGALTAAAPTGADLQDEVDRLTDELDRTRAERDAAVAERDALRIEGGNRPPGRFGESASVTLADLAAAQKASPVVGGPPSLAEVGVPPVDAAGQPLVTPPADEADRTEAAPTDPLTAPLPGSPAAKKRGR